MTTEGIIRKIQKVQCITFVITLTYLIFGMIIPIIIEICRFYNSFPKSSIMVYYSIILTFYYPFELYIYAIFMRLTYNFYHKYEIITSRANYWTIITIHLATIINSLLECFTFFFTLLKNFQLISNTTPSWYGLLFIFIAWLRGTVFTAQTVMIFAIINEARKVKTDQTAEKLQGDEGSSSCTMSLNESQEFALDTSI